MQTPDKKKQMFLDMQEHPENYTEEQIEAMMDELDQMPDVETAWQKFEQDRMPIAVRSTRRWMKVAASIIGVIMISGITLAAIHLVRQSVRVDLQSPTHETRILNSYQPTLAADTVRNDTISAKLRIFDNVQLDTMLMEIADYYHIEVDFQHDNSRQLRFHFEWKRNESLDRVVERLNSFEAVDIIHEPEKLIVK